VRAVHIRPLGPHDAGAYQALRLDGLRESPEAFGSTYDEDQALSLDQIAERLTPTRQPVARVVFGAFDGDVLIGVGGCAQQGKTKVRHKAIIWGMYVRPEQRGRGVARRLLDAIIVEARGWPEVECLTLTVVERATAARQLYRSAGFERFGREPDGLRQDGTRDTVEYLSRSLRAEDTSP
jgi:ribosomal protein S18 acetylase RimI-like enzyme